MVFETFHQPSVVIFWLYVLPLPCSAACTLTSRPRRHDPGQLQMIEESSMTQNSDSFFWICKRSNRNEASRILWSRLLPVLPLQNHRVFSAAPVLCAETSPLLCVCSERLPRDFQSSPVPARKEEHPVTSPVSAAQRNTVRVSMEQLQRNALCLLQLNTSSSVKMHSKWREDKCSWMLLLNQVYWIFAIQFIWSVA